MCTLCLSDMGELRDDWLQPPRTLLPAASGRDDEAVVTLLVSLARLVPAEQEAA